MAAWLAYLKSCLLLPKEAGVDPEPRGAGDAAAAAAAAAAGDARGRRPADRRATGSAATSSCGGAPEGLKVVRRSAWQADLYDLIAAYGIVRARTEPVVHVIARRPVMTLDEAIHRLEADDRRAARMDRARGVPARDPGSANIRRSALASSFVATLELARLGKVALRQEESVRAALS